MNAIAYAYVVGIQHHSYRLSEWLVQPKSLMVTGITVFIITAISFIQWRLLREGGDALALRMEASLVLMDTLDSAERQLLNVVEEMAIASGLAMPNVYVMERERGINAFVAGLNQSDAVLVVTHGALRELTRQELQGVIGHEFSHIFHSDMGINLNLISLLAGILFLSEAGRFVLSSSFDNDYSNPGSKGSGSPIIFLLPMGIVFFIVGSVGLFFARLIKSSICRQREYLADAAAVQYTRDNQGLASALYKISTLSDGSTLHSRFAEEASHMCFSESVSMFSGFLNGLLSTHPPINQRIKAICPSWIPGRDPKVSNTRKQHHSQQQTSLVSPVMAFAATQHNKHHLTQSIGQPTSKHLQEAQRIIEAIPASLRLAATNGDIKAHATQLVFALLLTDDGQLIDQAHAVIEQYYGLAARQQVKVLMEEIQQQPRQLRLAIFDLTVPALKQLTRTERKTLFEVLRHIIQLDSRISRFEYMLYWLLKKHLYGQAKRSKGSISNLKSVPNQVAIIVSMMIDTSSNDTKSRQQRFNMIMSSVGMPKMLIPATQFDANIIHKAVTTLTQLAPIPKKSLICALEDCITEDKRVEPEEAECLRVIAELMECPIPPIVFN
jgi:Zn-dependent protease with chaperone function/uncharacterized tellurite resistance protein B-like protein